MIPPSAINQIASQITNVAVQLALHFGQHAAQSVFERLQGAYDQRHNNLQGANLRGANLQYFKLFVADLQGANPQGANLQLTNLRGAKGLLQEQIEQAIGNETTKLPERVGLRRPKAWSKSFVEQIRLPRTYL